MLFAISLISIIVTLVDITLGVFSFSRKDPASLLLGATLVLSAVVCLTYTGSVLAGENYDLMSWFSSVYFSAVTLMCFTLAGYISFFTEQQKHIVNKRFAQFAFVFALIDVFFLMSNPVTHVVIDYTYSASALAHWRYSPHLLYQLHLLFTYILILFVVINLVIKIRTVPLVYRRRYRSPLIALLVIVAMNALFLFAPTTELFDFSVYFYSIAALIYYLNRYRYSKRLVTTDTYMLAMNELESIVVFFDYKQRFVSCNTRANDLIPLDQQNSTLTLGSLIERYHLETQVGALNEDVKFAWNACLNGRIAAFHCSLKLIHEEQGKLSGYLLVLTDNSLETDLLTGFCTKAAFERYFEIPEKAPIPNPSAVVACDINGLSLINNAHGREAGDIALAFLAQTLVDAFPPDTFFVRLEEGTLLAICSQLDSKKIDQVMKTIREIADAEAASKNDGEFRGIQYATCELNDRITSAIRASQVAMRSMRNRKMLDADSTHASLIASLAQAQRQNDGETEEHVTRTRLGGQLLAERLGLTDLQKSSLELLCLLHDIGKIGIPLEILNKPTKLSAAEWDVMKSHTTKGYKIANASPELSGIARLILCHHERWDGKGYPMGLEGQRIPLLSRIISVVDTYDAMTHDRPYRKALTSAEAKEELRRCAGTQFDPNIVEAFLAVLEENPQLATSDADNRRAYATLFEEDTPTPQVKGVTGPGQSSMPVPHGRYFLDENNIIIGADEGFALITGYSEIEAQRNQMSQYHLIPAEDLDDYLKLVEKELGNAAEAYIKHRIVRKDGVVCTVFCFGRNFYDPVARAMRSEIIITQVP